jgi:hypothetical protein
LPAAVDALLTTALAKEMVMPWVMGRGTGAGTATATHCRHGRKSTNLR